MTMRHARTKCKYAQRNVLRNEQSLRADSSLARILQSADIRVNPADILNSGKIPLINEIGNISGEASIAKMW